jgi:hypothetical protein
VKGYENLTWPLETCYGSLVDCNLTNSSSSAEGPWYRYNLYVNVVLCIAYCLVFIFGLVGNLLVAVDRSFVRRRPALADLLFNSISNLVHRKLFFDFSRSCGAYKLAIVNEARMTRPVRYTAKIIS